MKHEEDKSVLHPHKTNVVHKLYDTDHATILHIVNWYILGMYDGEEAPHSFCLAMNIDINSMDT
jgi:hypothetical protein